MLLTPEILAILMIVGIKCEVVGTQEHKWTSLDGGARLYYYPAGADGREDEYVSCYSNRQGLSTEITSSKILLDFLHKYF